MWKMVGTAVQGRSHIKNNIPTQDKYFYKQGKVNIIALADGAGSSKYSHYGAQLVVEKMCELVGNNFDYIYNLESVEEAQHYVISNLLEGLHHLADMHNEDLKEFASTLLCVAVKEEEILIFHLGDGEIGAIKKGEIVSLSSGMNGEYANSTYFVTSTYATDKMKIFKSTNMGKFTSFFLMSDGSAASLYSKRNHKFSEVIKNICIQSKFVSEQSMNEMLEDSFNNMIRMKTMDDCSFVAMTFVENPYTPYDSLSKSEKEFLLRGFTEKKHSSVNKMDQILHHIREPITLNDLSKRVHINKEYIYSTVNILNALGMIGKQNQKYYKIYEEVK